MLNLEDNGIESWEELTGFRHIPDFYKLILNKNKIPEVIMTNGWPCLEYLSIEDNLISDWKTFDVLNMLGVTGTGHAR
jgi:hypothetical protein